MLLWAIEKRSIKDLKDHPKNPRKLSKEDAEQLKISIERFGIIDKPIITKEGLIIGGHQRKRILKELGIKEIDCWVPSRDLTEEEVDELNVRLNRNTGEWDWDKLANEWEITDLLEWGFTLDEFDMGGDPEVVEEGADEKGVLEPAKDEDAFTKLGDVYEINGHRIVCGDSTDPDVAAAVLNGNEPSVMVTDPPYNVGYKYNSDSNDHRSEREYLDFINAFLSLGMGVAETAYITPGKVNLFSYPSEIIVDTLYWYKSNACSPGICSRFMTIEPILIIGKKTKGHPFDHDFFDIPQTQQPDVGSHTCPKPLELWCKLVKGAAAPGEGVYDPFLGSGTTLIACEQLGRICYGIELSPAYVDVIIGRWVRHMQKHNKSYTIKRNGEEITWEQ